MGRTADIIDVLKADYARFPRQQTYTIYAADVYFEDPLNRFRGLDRYRQMIALISRWFARIRLDLHHIHREDNQIETRWTLSWNAPLPWQPRIAIPGRSLLQLDSQGLIIAHIDYWDCSRLDVLRQHFRSLPTT